MEHITPRRAGPATSATTQSGTKNPQGVALDTAASRLFVADTNNPRVTIFDVLPSRTR
jgi:DNA-binding beta-propeller fold protein YncE